MGTKTLLDGVNEILKRVNVNAGNASALTSLTDSTRQHPIDISVQVINEGIYELYTASTIDLPGEGAESTITLATNTREYTLASDLVSLLWPMVDRTNTQYLYEFPGGYNAILLFDPQQAYTGLPFYGCINPANNKLRVERAPTSAENGRIYYYEYEKNLTLVNSTDTMPFNDATFISMVPAWAQLYKREMRNEFDGDLFRQAIGRACRTVTMTEQRRSYSPKAGLIAPYQYSDWPF